MFKRPLVLALTCLLSLPLLPAAGASAAPRDRAAEAFARLEQAARGHKVQVAGRADGVAQFVRADVPAGRFSARVDGVGRARDFLRSFGPLLGVDSVQDVAVRRTTRDTQGRSHVRFEQRHEGLRVYGRQIIVHLDADGALGANGDIESVDVDVVPAVDRRNAVAAATTAIGKGARSDAEPELLVYVDRANRSKLAWLVTVPVAEPVGLWRVFVDAHTGEVLDRIDDIRHAKTRYVHNHGNCGTCGLPGTLVRSEGGGATGDPDADAAYDNSGAAYDYFSSTFGRDSYDGAGHAVRSTVNYGVNYANAFWCPDDCASSFGAPSDGEQFVYGDGTAEFGQFARDPDVVTHEYSHGVTGSTAELLYIDQSGALDEAYADLFAAFSAEDWDIGEVSTTPGVADGLVLRDLANPGAGGYPDHMSEFVKSFYDGGGVHTNSLIPSHAAYRAVTTYGLSIAAAEQIYYRALAQYLVPNATFVYNLQALLAAAEDLYPGDDNKQEALIRAHEDVGIVLSPLALTPTGGTKLKGATPTTVTWSAVGAEYVPFDVEYVVPSGAAHYVQGFEAMTLPGGFTTPVGTTPWAPSTADWTSGVRSARSGEIGHDGRSVLSMTRAVTDPGTLEFNYRVDSEAWGDFFVLYIDGQLAWWDTGDTGWVHAEIPVTEGTHTFQWIFERDGDDVPEYEGSSAVFLDDLFLPNSQTFSPIDIGTGAEGASSIDWVTPAVSSAAYRVRLKASNAAEGLGEDISAPFIVDATAPTGANIASTLPPFLTSVSSRTSVTVPLRWSATDALTGISTYDLRWRYAWFDEQMPTGHSDFMLWTAATSQNAPISGGDFTGSTLCFGVRARDGVKNQSAYSGDRCTSVPFNNNDLGYTSGWKFVSATGHYLNSYSESTRAGAFLQSVPSRAKRVALVATTCSSCGTVEVYRGSTLLKRVSLVSSTTKKKVTIPIKTYTSVQSAAAFRVRVYSSGKLVRIEGLGISQA